MDKQEWVLVPLNLPHDVLGAAAAAGVFDTGNPSHGWDFLLRHVGIRAHPLHPAAFDAETLISRLMSADPEYEDCAAAAVLLRQITATAPLTSEIERLQASRSAEGDRLDWLLCKLPGSVLRNLVGDLSDTSDVVEWRAAIDRAAGFSPPNDQHNRPASAAIRVDAPVGRGR